MNVWLLQTGEPLHIDAGNPRPMRAMNLANALVEAGHKVVLWSSAFYHQEKRHRCHVAQCIIVSPQLEIRLIPSPGYVRNISPSRLWDHAVLARNLGQLLKQETKPPDVAFVGYPPIEVAAVMARWLSVQGVPSMLDIKDQWPNLFVEALPKSVWPLGRIALAPYFYLAKRTMRDVTGLSAMAEAFLTWSIDFAGRQRNDIDRVVPLTTPSGQVSPVELEVARQWWNNKGIVADGRLRICFLGSHSPAFDIEPIFEAAKYFLSLGNKCEFVICGDGGSSSGWRRLMSDLSNVHFPGWIDRAQIEALAERSHATITPYRNIDNFTKNLPNKVIDALSLGLPIISPLQGEVAKLISNHGVGLRYGVDSQKTLIQCIEMLLANPMLRQQISRNALNLYREKFSFEIVYGGLVSHLEELSLKKWSGSEMDKDKLIELNRYDMRAQSQLAASGIEAVTGTIGSSTMPQHLRAPYIAYEKYVRELIGSQDRVLELGAGTGLHTWILVQTGAQVTATDISPNSLKLLEQRIVNAGGEVRTKVADLEFLPFDDASFDVVVCAGSLSYGDPERVDAEVRRVLKPGGLFICVDTLNHNPIFKLNRWIHYLRGNRTIRTLVYMPTLSRIYKMAAQFETIEVRYFGALIWAMPILVKVFGVKRASNFSDVIDRFFRVKSSAFKFVFVAQNRR